MASYPGNISPAVTVAVALAVSVVFYYARMVWKIRAPMRRVIRLGKPVPAWNNIMGNLLVAGGIFSHLPEGCHSAYMLRAVSKRFPKHGAFYFDAWPMMEPMLVITDPAMAQKVVMHPKVGTTKPAILQKWFHPITGGPSLFDTNGPVWKSLHKTYSPAFSPSNMVAWFPVIIDRITIFRGLLREKAQTGDRFLLEPLALNLITDIIGEILLNLQLNSQRSTHPLCEYMTAQLALKFTEYKPQNLLAYINPSLYYRTWKNSQLLDKEIRTQLQARFAALKAQQSPSSSSSTPSKPPFKSVIDLAIEDFLSQPSNAAATSLTPDFLTTATRNMRMFFFAGYDSTATTILFCYYNLFRNPPALARLRAEHDALFGTDPDSAPGRIASDPHILNSLPYTQAVIKESLRLFPVANGVRYAEDDIGLADDDGTTYPTKDFSILMSHYAIQRNPSFWPDPDAFLPDRWLVEPGHRLYPPKGGWRPFEAGSRMCVAQQLVMAEVKSVLACTVREFDIREAYAEVDGGEKMDLTGVDGERVFMVEGGASHPNGQFPARVTFSGYVPGERK
ncbi:cytochrome P450 [Coniochaeta sp. PMI_546]|nr:cytochrome P450 [Coniochaeta sp. PMI_546]